MIQVKIKAVSLIFGIFGITYYTMMILHYRHQCSIRFDNSKYENITYVLQQSYSSPSPAYDLLPEADYHTLMDVNFTFTVTNLVCDDTEPLLLVLIHSAPKNFAKRKVIRETWGKTDEDIKLLFLLGTPGDSEVHNSLKNENFLYKDLLQGSFLDSYRNLTYKHVMALKFVTYHCPQAKYILKIDDDVGVNTPLLKNFLTKDLSPFGAKNLLMCNVIRRTKALRGFRSKWRVTFDEYREVFYPPYCLGWYILYSPDLVFQLYREAQRTEYFWIDDVLITGVVAAKLNFVSHTDISILTLSNGNICRPFLFGQADMTESEIRSLWEDNANKPVMKSVTKTVNTESYKHKTTLT